MSESDTPNPARQLVFAYQLDAPPEKVWRALSIPAFRERWLPAEVEAVSAVPGEAVCYRLTEEEPPFLDSIVTFQIAPKAGGTELRIIHRPADAGLVGQMQAPANSNQPRMLRAA